VPRKPSAPPWENLPDNQALQGRIKVDHVEEVRRYILNQAEHHRRKSFQDEFRSFLKRHCVAYDEKYLWD
jgi:hypothetical protein